MQAGGAPHLSIVIPAFNEATRLPLSLPELIAFSRECTFPVEVLIVVEKSSDGTFELASRTLSKQENFQVIDNKVRRGKGYAVRTGMLRARGEFVFYMDADLSVPLREVSHFLAWLESHPGVDVVVGNRQHAQSAILQSQSLLRRKMGQTFNRLIQCLSLVKLRDTQCGFKAFRSEAAREVFSRQTLDGFAFDVEVLLLAAGLGYKVADLPVEWKNWPDSKVRIVRDSLAMIADTLRVRRNVERNLAASKKKA